MHVISWIEETLCCRLFQRDKLRNGLKRSDTGIARGGGKNYDGTVELLTTHTCISSRVEILSPIDIYLFLATS